MSIKTSALLASRMLLPKVNRKSVGTKSILGAVICIALSLIPLVTVLSVTDGMIEGITERLINLSSSHIQAQFTYFGDETIEKDFIDFCRDKVKEVPEVKEAYELISSSGFVSSKSGRCGALIRAVERDTFEKVDSYNKLFSCIEGSTDNFVNSDKIINLSSFSESMLPCPPAGSIK